MGPEVGGDIRILGLEEEGLMVLFIKLFPGKVHRVTFSENGNIEGGPY